MWIGSGWKMNKTQHEAAAYVRQLRLFIKENPDNLWFVVPPFTALCGVAEMLAGCAAMVCAYNMHWD